MTFDKVCIVHIKHGKADRPGALVCMCWLRT